MPANNWWSRQLFEGMKEASRWYKDFCFSQDRNIDSYDKALAIYELYIDAYKLNQITFSEFIQIGQSLRARQALTKIQRENDYES